MSAGVERETGDGGNISINNQRYQLLGSQCVRWERLGTRPFPELSGHLYRSAETVCFEISPNASRYDIKIINQWKHNMYLFILLLTMTQSCRLENYRPTVKLFQKFIFLRL